MYRDVPSPLNRQIDTTENITFLQFRCRVVIKPYINQKLQTPDSVTGCSVRHTDLVDNRGEHRVRTPGGGVRERAQGLLQEAGGAAQRPHHHADRAAQQGRPTEDHDDLYHRRSCPRCRHQTHQPEGTCCV